MNHYEECRTCLHQFIVTDLLNVETNVIDQKNVLQGINEVASIEVLDNEFFPKYICHLCFDLLASALTFRRQIIFTHIELKKRHESDLRDPLFINCDDPNLEEKSLCQAKQNEDSDKESEEEGKSEVKLEKITSDVKENPPEEQNGGFYPLETKMSPEDSDSDWNVPSNTGNVIPTSDDSILDEVKPPPKKVKSISRRTRRRRRLKAVKKEVVNHSSASEANSDTEDFFKREEADVKKKKKAPPGDALEGPRLCPICGKLFKARQNFNSHMTTVHKKGLEKPEKISCLCPDCGRVITGTRQNFVAHRRYHHSDKAQVKKRFTCELCPRKFYREKNLVIHQRIHEGQKGYVCELCPDKSYTQIGGLILHKRKVHLKKPTCTCNYCGKQFYEKHYLETHIRQWHTGERPFSCEICGKAFSCNGTLLRHRKDSHGEKKPCPKCGKMYTEGELRKHLKRHKIREEGIKRKKYTCEYCGTEMNFTSRKRHLLKQHGIMLRGRGETAERISVPTDDVL